MEGLAGDPPKIDPEVDEAACPLPPPKMLAGFGWLKTF
jgi:hypothetical protein